MVEQAGAVRGPNKDECGLFQKGSRPPGRGWWSSDDVACAYRRLSLENLKAEMFDGDSAGIVELTKSPEYSRCDSTRLIFTGLGAAAVVGGALVRAGCR